MITSGNEPEPEHMQQQEEEEEERCLWEERLPNEIQQAILENIVNDRVTYVVIRFVSKGFKVATEVLLGLKGGDDSWSAKARRFSKEAAASGNLDLLKWGRENGCPWDEWTCTLAAAGGHLDTLQWARENGCLE